MIRYRNVRSAPAAEWQAANIILPVGAIGVEEDTKKSKVGDGVTVWSELPYAGSPVSSVFGRTGAVVAQSGDYSFDQISGSIDGGSF